MSVSFRKFKTDLTRKFVKRGLTPNFEDPNYQRCRLFWDDFVAYRTSDEAKEVSERKHANAAKNLYPHRLGPSGYAKNVDKWRAREDELLEKGIEIETKDWCQRGKNYQYARGATLSDTGELVHKCSSSEEVSRRLHDAHQKSLEGSFVPSREKDEVTLALQNVVHPGRTRGVGLVPWREGFPEDRHRYRSHSNKNSIDQSEEIRQLEERIVRMEALLMAAGFERQDGGDAGRVSSPLRRKSSCASIEVSQEPNTTRHPVDAITVCTACRLHVPFHNLTIEVERGMAHPVVEGGRIHGNPIPTGYSRVKVENVSSRYRALQLEFPPDERVNTLGEAVHNIILWRKRFIVVSSGDGDDESSDGGFSSEGHAVSSRKMPTSPPLPCKSPSPSSAQRPLEGAHSSLASEDQPKKRGRLCKSSEMSEPPSLKKTTKAAFPSMSKPSLKVSVEEQDHFIRMARPPALKQPISDFQRTINKKKLRAFFREEFAKDKAKKNEQEFLEGAGLKSLSDVNNIAKAPLVDKFKFGDPLTTDDYRNVVGKCTQMRRIEEWYLQMSKEGKETFPVFYRNEDFHHEGGVIWVSFEELFQLYNLRKLDISLLQLWTLMEMLECRATHNKVGFLDPAVVNSNLIDDGLKSQKRVLDYLYNSFVKLQDMNTILLPYNFKHHWMLLAIHLNDSKIVIMDGLRKSSEAFQSVINILNKALVKYKKCIRHAPCANTFRVCFHRWCSHQDPGTSTCGFYVMKFMWLFMDDDNWNISDSEKLKLPTSKLLPHVCFALVEQLCGFIFQHVISSNGAYHVSRALDGLVGFLEAGGLSDTLDSRSTTMDMQTKH